MRRLVVVVSLLFVLSGLLFLSSPAFADYPQFYGGECEDRACVPVTLGYESLGTSSTCAAVSRTYDEVYINPEDFGDLYLLADSGAYSCQNCGNPCTVGHILYAGCDRGWFFTAYPKETRDYQVLWDLKHESSGQMVYACMETTHGTYIGNWSVAGRTCPCSGYTSWGAYSMYGDALNQKSGPMTDTDAARNYYDYPARYHAHRKISTCGNCSIGNIGQSGDSKMYIKVQQAMYSGVPFSGDAFDHINPGSWYNDVTGTTSEDCYLPLLSGDGYTYDGDLSLGIYELIQSGSGQTWGDRSLWAASDQSSGSYLISGSFGVVYPVWKNWFSGWRIKLDPSKYVFVGWRRIDGYIQLGLFYGDNVLTATALQVVDDNSDSALVLDGVAFEVNFNAGSITGSMSVDGTPIASISTSVSEVAAYNVGLYLGATTYQTENALVKVAFDYFCVTGGGFQPTPTPTLTPTATGTPTLTPTPYFSETTPVFTPSPTVEVITPTVTPDPLDPSFTPGVGTPLPPGAGTPWPYGPIEVNFPTATSTPPWQPIEVHRDPVGACVRYWPTNTRAFWSFDLGVLQCRLGCIPMPWDVGRVISGQFWSTGICFDYYYPDKFRVFGQEYIGVVYAVGLGALTLSIFALIYKSVGG